MKKSDTDFRVQCEVVQLFLFQQSFLFQKNYFRVAVFPRKMVLKTNVNRKSKGTHLV